MLTRLYWAMGAYAVLAALVFFTLDGVFRYGVWILRSNLKHVPFRNAAQGDHSLKIRYLYRKT